ncbi:MAG: hypothetical protein E7466_06155 [Ruminococcaceae bacterium]|nr:hypothetical protein [Oscillospiraceae bacterium]
MKKIFGWLLALVMVLALAGCGTSSVEQEGADTGSNASMFVEVESAMNWYVVYHRDTKVMYAVSDGSYNHGTFTMLVDADGKPLLWEG